MAGWSKKKSHRKDNSEDQKTLGEFFDVHYEKFAIMGIFVTVSVFLQSDWPGTSDSLTARLAIVASLAFFTLTSLWIMNASIKQIQYLDNDEWPGWTEAGYALLTGVTSILAITVGSVTTQFSTSFQIITEIVLLSLLVLAYIRINPFISGEESDGINATDFIRGISFSGGWWLTSIYFESTVREIARWVPKIDSLFIIHYLITFLLFQFGIQIGMLGIISIDWKSDISIRERLLSPWPVARSFGFSLIALFVLTFLTERTAQQEMGTQYGDFYVLSHSWKELLLIHWLAFTIACVALVLLLENRLEYEEYIRRISQISTVLSVMYSIYFLLFVLPKGRPVILLG